MHIQFYPLITLNPFLIFQDLILFPSDACFVKVSQSSSGRVYVLKFSSSNQRHFVSFQLFFKHLFSNVINCVRLQFWMQVLKALSSHMPRSS